MIVAPANGSVGETIAPSTNAAAQVRPPISWCATTATPVIVASTRPIDDSVRARRLARKSPTFAKNAAP